MFSAMVWKRCVPCSTSRTSQPSRPLLILLDLDLPRLSGIEFLDALRSDPRLCGTVVFVLTLSDRTEDKLAAYDRQVAGYLLKSKLGENFALLPKLLRSYCRLVAPQMVPSQVQTSSILKAQPL